jgi:uncharacterized delta-60 repeat protein
MLRRTLAAATAVAAIAAPAAAQAAPGDLDPLFGTGGIALDSRSFFASDVVVTPDGGAVMATESWTLVKLRADGTRDPAFGDGGVAQLIDPEVDGGDVRALALDAEGRILAAGSTPGTADAVVRVLPDGTLDPTWGAAEDGHRVRVTFGVFQSHSVRALTMTPQGDVLVAGGGFASGRDTAAVARLSPDGAYDSTFSGDGRQTFSVVDTDSRFTSLVSDGTGGAFLAGLTRHDAYLAHVRSDGTPDPAFGEDGRLVLHVGEAEFDQASLQGVTLAGGRVVAAGLTAPAEPTGDDGDGLLVSVDPTGALTPGFGDGGVRVLDLDPEGFDELTSIDASVDGDVIVGGAIGFAGSRDAIVARVLGAGGALDDGFGTGGVVRYDLPSGGAIVRALQRDAFGAITAVGTSRDNILAMRLADRGETPRPQGGGQTPDTPPPTGATPQPQPAADPPPAGTSAGQATGSEPATTSTGTGAAYRPAAWFHRVRAAKRSRAVTRLAGEADQGAARVQVTITRRDGRTCQAVTSTRRVKLSKPTACKTVKRRWLVAKNTPRTGKTQTWTLKLAQRLPGGRYTATVRALDQDGLAGKTGHVRFRAR